MEQPEIFTPEAYEAVRDSMQPIYGQTKGLGNEANVPGCGSGAGAKAAGAGISASLSPGKI